MNKTTNNRQSPPTWDCTMGSFLTEG